MGEKKCSAVVHGSCGLLAEFAEWQMPPEGHARPLSWSSPERRANRGTEKILGLPWRSSSTWLLLIILPSWLQPTWVHLYTPCACVCVCFNTSYTYQVNWLLVKHLELCNILMNGPCCFHPSDPLEGNTRRLKFKPFAFVRVCAFHYSSCTMDDWELKQKAMLRKGLDMSDVSDAPPSSLM